MKDIKKKRYLFFISTTYYPSGGMNDVEFSFDTKDEMLEEIKDRKIEDEKIFGVYQVFDIETFKFAESRELKNIIENIGL